MPIGIGHDGVVLQGPLGPSHIITVLFIERVHGISQAHSTGVLVLFDR